jgi:hypothetical protein
MGSHREEKHLVFECAGAEFEWISLEDMLESIPV